MAEAATALKDAGNKCLAAKDYAGAIAKYTEAIALDPANSVFYSNRSAAYLSKGDASAALADADKCIELKPDWSKGYGRKGAAHHALHEYDEAYDAYERGLSVDPKDTALSKGMEQVANVMRARMGNRNPLAGLFNPENIARLKAHPQTGPFFADPSFAQLMATAGSNPNGMQLIQSDPRFLQCLQVLLQGSPGMQEAAREEQEERARKEDEETRATPKGYGSWAPPKEAEKKKEEAEEEEEDELTADELAERQRQAEAEAERKKVRDAAEAKKAEVRALRAYLRPHLLPA
jgi:stress-induced-phosphoprotein 1